MIIQPTHLWRWKRQNVPKRRILIFRRRGNTQKKIYHIYSTAKVWKLRQSTSVGRKLQVTFDIVHTYPPVKREPTECSETSALIFRRRENTQKKICHVYSTAKIWKLRQFTSMGRKLQVTFDIIHTYLPVRMELPECSETSDFNIKTPGKYPEENLPYLCQDH
jgi:hypothetical protein